MSNPIISVEGLGKSYLVGHESGSRERYTALRDVLGRHAKNFARKGFDMLRGRQIVQGDEVEEFWALKDVSFEVNQGEVVGIIGRNGAGKSTLLKILSRITEPTEGRVTLRGRVASLLEVGTGFHPELTGRENIYLNGAILGMTRREIKRKFDEIVDFAGVEKFLDTPVKRYSSGMYVRLAFAVAAHLEPEILVVDEVLAVGDAEFQKKCLGKMKDVAEGGRTVLFVSHNMRAIAKLCETSALLVQGKLVQSGLTEGVIEHYNGMLPIASVSTSYNSERNRPVDGPYIESIQLSSSTESPFPSDNCVRCRVRIRGGAGHPKLVLGLHIRNQLDVEVIHSSSEFEGDFQSEDKNEAIVKWVIPPSYLNVGRYSCLIRLAERNHKIFDQVESKICFEIANHKLDAATTDAWDWKGTLPPQVIQWHFPAT